MHHIRSHITCEALHVIDVVKCKRCSRLGVGGTEAPKKRLNDHIKAATGIPVYTTSAIEKHFLQEEDCDLFDLQFNFVDALPQLAKLTPACADAERARLAEVWINKLGATLSVAKQARHSFSGNGKASWL